MNTLSVSKQLENTFNDEIECWKTHYNSKWSDGFLKSHYLERLANERKKNNDSLDLEQLDKIDKSSNYDSPEAAQSYLRHYKKNFSFWLLKKSLMENLPEEECLKLLSTFADHCLRFAAEFSQTFWQKRYEVDSSFLVLALGKLGGGELNFSSDVDLMFTYLDDSANKKSAISLQDFYLKVAKLFIKLIDELTIDGRVFRVDLRLRPLGEAGPLVLGLKELERYYQDHGRGWERYALQKTRVINGTREAQKKIYEVTEPFVYRRYLDYGVFEVLRSLKAIINREVQQKSLMDDVKRGLGGIREVEFICQSFQLIHGGKNKRIRTASLLMALKRLGKSGLIKNEEVAALKENYIYLRQLENRLQMFDDQQTHSLPENKDTLARICYAMGHDSIDEFKSKLKSTRSFIHQFFLSMTRDPAIPTESNDLRPKLEEVRALWQMHLTEPSAFDLLSSLNFKQPEAVYKALRTFALSPRLTSISEEARQRLNNFIPLLFVELNQLTSPDQCFFRLLSLLEMIVRRSSYLALLTENRQALQRVVSFFSKSQMIATQICEKPYLLEVLLGFSLDDFLFFELEDFLLEGQEEAMDRLRAFKNTNTLKIACLEIEKKIDVSKSSQLLSKLAETCLHLSIQYLAQRFPDLSIENSLLVIAYGRFAGQEMGYTSDLDLVFLYQGEREQHDTYLKFVKKLIKFLSLSTASGCLYQIDSRLRPSGSSGLLVSDIDQFEQYQCDKAWTWEHQALIRSTAVYGEKHLKAKFEKIRENALTKEREPSMLKSEILEMREKITQFKGRNKDDFKLAKGGLVDLEFALQYLILKDAYTIPNLIQCIGVLSQLEALVKNSILDKEDYKQAREGYLALKKEEHHHFLGLSGNISKFKPNENINNLIQKFYTRELYP